MSPPRFVRLSVRCPGCGRPPRLRLSADEVSRYEREDPGKVVLTYHCHAGRCGTIYNILAAAFQYAA